MNPTKTLPRPLARPLLALGGAALFLFAAAAPADASTQIGQAYPPYAGGECGGALIVQTAIQYGPSYVVPAGGGVITAWGTATATKAGTDKLDVLRPTGAGQYTVLATDGPRPIAANTSPTFTGLRIPVQSGDMIGLIAKGTNCLTRFIGSSFAVASLGLVDPAPGALAKTVASEPEYAVSVTATVEPDADHDGYGDETQDACPADPSAQAAPCPVPAPAVAPAGDTTPPLLQLRGRRVQKALRRDAVVELARSDESASLRATASLTIEGGPRLRLRATSASASPGTAERLVLRIPRSQRDRLRVALRQGKRVRGVVRVSAADAAGNSSRASRVVWLSG